MIDYLKKYCELANNLDCQNIVFGSPKSRTTYGLNRDELDKIFIDVLYEIDKNANKTEALNVNSKILDDLFFIRSKFNFNFNSLKKITNKIIQKKERLHV